MGKLALRQKLRSIKFSVRHATIGVLALISGGLLWLLEQIWTDTIVSSIKTYLPSSKMIIAIAEWGVNHPGEISMTIFFLAFTYLAFQVIQQTKPVKNIKLALAPSELSYLNYGGITIANLTGYDLKNCSIELVKVNGKEIEHKLLSWGDNGFSYKPVDILNGGKASVFLHQVFHDIKERIENNMFVFPDIASEIELFFRGNTNAGDTKSLSIWVMIKGKVVANEPHVTSYRAIIEHIETSLPEFG